MIKSIAFAIMCYFGSFYKHKSICDMSYLKNNQYILVVYNPVNINLLYTFIDFNMQCEGKSYDTVDVYNFYNGEFYGTNYGLTYYAFLYFTGRTMDKHNFMNMSYDDVKKIFFNHAIKIEPKYVYDFDLTYLYIFYIFRFTKQTYIIDYKSCQECENVSLCIKKKLESRLKTLIKQNPYYALGFVNRYYIYYNMSSKYLSYFMIPELW